MTSIRFGGPMFRKLLLTALVLILAAVALSDLLLTRYTADRETRNTEMRLSAQARILAGELAALSGPAKRRCSATRWMPSGRSACLICVV